MVGTSLIIVAITVIDMRVEGFEFQVFLKVRFRGLGACLLSTPSKSSAFAAIRKP